MFKLNAVLKHESENPKFVVNAKEKMCQCHLKEGNSKDAIKLCSETIEMEPQNAHAYCDRAEAYLLEDNLDEGKCLYFGIFIFYFYHAIYKEVMFFIFL